MIGWKRIVVTVGEKIGKEHLTYAQGASAELVAVTTIALADQYGLPVSTTHVLSSGIAGTMFANRSGLQADNVAQHFAGLGSDAAYLRTAWRRNILRLLVPAAERLRSALSAESLRQE
jgi:phosphate/sulfate permease